MRDDRTFLRCAYKLCEGETSKVFNFPFRSSSLSSPARSLWCLVPVDWVFPSLGFSLRSSHSSEKFSAAFFHQSVKPTISKNVEKLLESQVDARCLVPHSTVVSIFFFYCISLSSPLRPSTRTMVFTMSVWNYVGCRWDIKRANIIYLHNLVGEQQHLLCWFKLWTCVVARRRFLYMKG